MFQISVTPLGSSQGAREGGKEQPRTGTLTGEEVLLSAQRSAPNRMRGRRR